jgi:hypothetical protein
MFRSAAVVVAERGEQDAWWIYRWARRGTRSDDRFAELCRTR